MPEYYLDADELWPCFAIRDRDDAGVCVRVDLDDAIISRYRTARSELRDASVPIELAWDEARRSLVVRHD